MSLVAESLHNFTFLNVVDGLAVIACVVGVVVLVRRLFTI